MEGSMAGKPKAKTAIRMDSVLGGIPSEAEVGTTKLKSKVSITSGSFFSESLQGDARLPPGAMLPVSPSPVSNRPAHSPLTPPRTTPFKGGDTSPSLPADSPRRLQPSDGRSGSVVIWGDGWEKSSTSSTTFSVSDRTPRGNVSVMAPQVERSAEQEQEEREAGEEGEVRSPFSSPQVDRELDGKKMLCVCGGFGEIALLLEGGELVVSGGEEQQWGGDSMNKPMRQVVSGFQHTLFLTQGGELYSLGTNTFGQLGFTGSGIECIPRIVPAFATREVAAVACGQYHSLCVTNGGEVFSWGRGTEGQLGLGNASSVPVPRFVKALSGKFVDAIAAGWNASCAVTAMGELMVWGDNSVGQLGLGKGKGRQTSPVHVPLPASCSENPNPLAASVCSGWGHTVAASLDGAVFSWGFGGRGQLGHGDRESNWSPRLIEDLQGTDVKRLCCGAHFTVALTSTGEVYVWGSGSHHRLGLGDSKDRLVPTLTPLRGREITQIAVCETKVLAFAPIRLLAISPNSGPLQGGTALKITGDGFFEGSRVKASLDFSKFLGTSTGGFDAHGEVRLARGTYDEATGEVHMEAPRVNAPATCVLELSFDNGETYTSSGLTFTFYEPPTLASVFPAFRVSEGEVLLSVLGEGLEQARSHAVVRLTREAEAEGSSPAAEQLEGGEETGGGEKGETGEKKEVGLEQGQMDILVKASYDISTRSLSFLSPPMPPGNFLLRVAINGQQYADQALRVTYYSLPKLLEVVPDSVPIQGGSVTVSVENLLPSVQARIRGPALAEEGLRLSTLAVDVAAGNAELEVPADVPVGPATLEISVDDGQTWTEESGLSLYVFPPLAPTLDIAYAHRGGDSQKVLKEAALFPARGLKVTVGNVAVPAKFDMARGGVTFAAPPFDPAMPRAPRPSWADADGEEEEEGGLAYVAVSFSPDNKASFAVGTLCYLQEFTFDGIKPSKSGKGAAPTAITISGSGFTDTGSLVVRFTPEDGAARYEEAEFASESSLSVTSPEGLEPGACQLALSLDGRRGVFEECGTAFTVVA